MDNYTLQAKPSKLIPILIGGAVMAATSVIPVLNWINCLCCAGIMGGAVLSAYLYKKNFPEGMIFSTGDGAAVGVLAGLFGAVVTSIISALMFGLSSQGFSVQFDESFERAIQQVQSTGGDAHAVEQIREFIVQIAQSPFLLFIIILVFSLLLFAAFGALGGLIGGSIFKTRVVPTIPPSQNIGSSS